MKNLLGGRGDNWAEICRLGIPVLPGLRIGTEAYTFYTECGRDQALALIDPEVCSDFGFVEQAMGKRGGDAADPLL